MPSIAEPAGAPATLEPQFGRVLCRSRSGLHAMAYADSGHPASRVAVCVHGLTRQGRNFDALALALAGRGSRVICPDLVGRGRSDWLADPADYEVAQCVGDVVTLLARIGAAGIDFVGTSLGGMTGIHPAALKGAPIRRMVVNDIGTTCPGKRSTASRHTCGSCRSRCRTGAPRRPISARCWPLRSARRGGVAASDAPQHRGRGGRALPASGRSGGRAHVPPCHVLERQHVAALGRDTLSGAHPAGRTFRPAVARGGRTDEAARSALEAGRVPRLRTCARAARSPSDWRRRQIADPTRGRLTFRCPDLVRGFIAISRNGGADCRPASMRNCLQLQPTRPRAEAADRDHHHRHAAHDQSEHARRAELAQGWKKLCGGRRGFGTIVAG